MADYVKTLDIQLVSLNDFYLNLNVNEIGLEPRDNAKIKAYAYFQALKVPLFACDSGLIFKNIPMEFKPGVNIRRVKGKTLSDDETIEYYSSLAARFDNKLMAQYKNAVCLIISENEIYEYAGEDIDGEAFIISNNK